MLRGALVVGVESGESATSENAIKLQPEEVVQRFEHYKLVTGEDGNRSGCDGRDAQGYGTAGHSGRSSPQTPRMEHWSDRNCRLMQERTEGQLNRAALIRLTICQSADRRGENSDQDLT